MPLSRVLIIEDDQICLDTLSSTLRLKLPGTHIDEAVVRLVGPPPQPRDYSR